MTRRAAFMQGFWIGARDAVLTVGPFAIIAAFAIALWSCSTQQAATGTSAVQTGLSAIESACLAAEQAKITAQALVKGGAANTVNSIGQYVDAACGTAAALDAISRDPTSAEWLGRLTGTLATIAKPPAI